MTLKASDRGAVVRLQPKFSFSVLALLFRLQNSSKLKLFCENYLDGKHV